VISPDARPRAWMSWSSGKDSATALHLARSQGHLEVTALLTTFNADAGRVAMHAVPRHLVEAQARAVGLPLVTVDIPSPCPSEVYEAAMAKAMARAVAEGVAHVVFGDLFLADVRAYREARLAGTGIEPIFPPWTRPTEVLARDMVASGLKAVLTCGERGEFHTFVWDGPGFDAPIPVEPGERVERDGFVFCDLVGPKPA